MPGKGREKVQKYGEIMEIKMNDYLSLNRIMFLNSLSKEGVIDELIKISRDDGKVKDMRSFKEALIERESLLSTGIGYGMAIPHVKLLHLDNFFITIGIHKRGVNWDSLDDKPAHIIFLIAGPENQQERYLRILARLTFAIKSPEKRERLTKCKTRYEVFELFSGL